MIVFNPKYIPQKSAKNIVKKACVELGYKIGKDANPRVSFDVAEIKGKAVLSVQKLITEKNKGVYLKVFKGKDNASMLPAKGKERTLKSFIQKSPRVVSVKINEMSVALKKAARDEAKSLTDFT